MSIWYLFLPDEERELIDAEWGYRNYESIYRKVYMEERAMEEWIDIGGEGG
jgi:hypothetical protein